MKIEKYLKKCEKFDINFKERESDYIKIMILKKISKKEIAYNLSTFLFDRNFNINEESWEWLIKISNVFGLKIVFKVIKNIFYSDFDT